MGISGSSSSKVPSAAVMALTLFLLLSVTPGSAQGGEAVVVATGAETGFNNDLAGDPPQKDYDRMPPVMASARVGSGAVVVGGMAGACRNDHWNNPENPYPYLDKLLDVIFQWMVSGAEDVLWYEGYSVYNNTVQCENLIDSLEALGYTITGDKTEPISDITLTDYHIMVIPQMQLGDTGTGGDPSALPDDDVQAIVNFVEGGGGLLVMDQADYGGHNFYKVQNKILEGLGVDVRLQDDQVQDSINQWGGQIYRPLITIDTTTEIGSAYESVTGESVIGLDSLCSIRMVKDYDLNVRVSPSIGVGEAGKELTFDGEVVNIGTESDSYTITLEDELGWPLSVSPAELSLGTGEEGSVTIHVTVPEGLTEKVPDWITLRVVGASGIEDNAVFRAINCFPLDEPPFPIVKPDEEHFWFSICTILVEPPAVPIMTGIETGFSKDCVPREPQPILYCKGEFPVIAAAALVGDGRIIAAGPACLRSSPSDYYTNPLLATREYAPRWPRWLIDWGDPAGKKFLYFATVDFGAFHDNTKVAIWLDDMRDLGFDVIIKQEGEITPEVLEDCSILQIAELKRPLTAGEKQAIKDWVEAGGGLLLMCQADYGGWGMPQYPNELLEALEVPVTFQDDELYDEDSWRVDGPWFPQVYILDPREANPEFDVWFPEILPSISLDYAWIKAKDIRAVFNLTIRNDGTKDATFGIEAKETSGEPLGWEVEVKPAEVEVKSGETVEVTIAVSVPEVEVIRTMDLQVKVTALEKPFIKKYADFAVFGDPDYTQPSPEFGVEETVYHENLGECTVRSPAYGWNFDSLVVAVETETGEIKYVREDQLSSAVPPPPEIPWMIVAGVIIVIVVIAIAALYWVKK